MTTTTEGTGQGSAEGPLRGFDLDNIRKVYVYQSGNLLPCIYIIGSGGTEKYVLRVAGDGQVKIDSTDIADYLGVKLVAGTNITLVPSAGPNKTITINSAGGSGWTDDGTIVRLTTSTDDVGIGTVVAEGKTTIITDSAAKIPLVLKNASGQSTYAFAIKDSGGTVRNAISLGSSIASGTLNTNLGANAGVALTTGIQDTFIGESAGLSNTIGSFNTAVGNKALQSNVSSGVNTAIGHECMRDYTGEYNTAVGAGAMKICTSGNGNVAIGANAMHDFGPPSTNAGFNVAVGRDAMAEIDAGGGNNVAVGYAAGRRIFSGIDNVCIGINAAVGGGAFGLTIGSHNVIVGAHTCSTATFTGTNNTVVGHSATLATGGTLDATSLGDGTTVHTDSIVLGRLAASTASNQLVAGSSLHPINDIYSGKGVTNATPTEYRVNGTGGSGANIAGADLVVAGGKGTGSALPGQAAVKYSLIEASSSTLQSLSSDKFVIDTTMFTATATGTVANTVTETTMLGTGIGTKTIPAGFFVPGRTIKLTVRGIYSNTGIPTLQIQCKLGSTVIGNTGANATVAATNSFFEISEILTCRTVGATGTVFAQGFFDEHSSSFSRHAMTNTTTTTIDTTVSQAIDVTATWGTADPANTISATNVIIEVLN